MGVVFEALNRKLAEQQGGQAGGSAPPAPMTFANLAANAQGQSGGALGSPQLGGLASVLAGLGGAGSGSGGTRPLGTPMTGVTASEPSVNTGQNTLVSGASGTQT